MSNCFYFLNRWLRKSSLISFVILLSSCVSKSNLKKVDTYFRLSEIQEASIAVTPVVVDLCIDFDKIVSGKSKVCLTEQEALEGAQYDALISSKDVNLAVLVSPVYFVTREETIKRKKSTFTYSAEVIAFSGTYCQQYSMIEALEKAKPMTKNLFVKEALMKDFATESFGMKDVLISDVFIVHSKAQSGANATQDLNINDVIQQEIASANEEKETRNPVRLNLDTTQITVDGQTNTLDNDSLPMLDQSRVSANQDSLLSNVEGQTSSEGQDSLKTPLKQGEPQRSDSLNFSDVDLGKRVSKDWNEENNSKTKLDSVKIDETSGRLLLDEHFKSQYYQEIVLDSASNIIEEGKDQIDFIMHNDDYITRWMRENTELSRQLIMFKKILTAEASFMDIKYKKERTKEDDQRLGALDLELLEYEYLNRKKLLFYSSFNFQRSKKLIMDCYLTCHDTLKPVVLKYIELADYMLAKDRVPMQVNSKDPLMVNGLPLRRKLNSEFFASELYIRGWEICSGMRKAFGEYPVKDLYQTDSLNVNRNADQDEVRFEEGEDKAYRLKGYNSQKFFQKVFPVNSYNYLMQYGAQLPDTLKQVVFKTFKNPSIDEDAVFAENIKYPSGLIYVIQVGAFRKPIPVNFYENFAPVVKEYKSEGVYRYTVGFFPKYNSALIALKQVKGLGYKDAFIVALQDGKRIQIPEKIRLK